MRISIGNDHAGTEYKFEIIKHLNSKNIEITNYGTDSTESADYPDFVHPVALDVASSNSDFGIIICGTGSGANMTANKYKGVRSAVCWMKEIAVLAREHNNANILSIPARYTSLPQTIDIVNSFLESKFQGGRHKRRIDKIDISG